MFDGGIVLPLNTVDCSGYEVAGVVCYGGDGDFYGLFCHGFVLVCLLFICGSGSFRKVLCNGLPQSVPNIAPLRCRARSCRVSCS